MKAILYKIFMWKCPLLPTLTLPMWRALWGINGAVIVAYIVGLAAGWWGANSDVTIGVNIVNALLIVTPMEYTHWMVGPKGGGPDDFRFVSQRKAKRILYGGPNRAEPLEVMCVTTRKGDVVRIAHYTPKEIA
jgi:hypothetical protein